MIGSKNSIRPKFSLAVVNGLSGGKGMPSGRRVNSSLRSARSAGTSGVEVSGNDAAAEIRIAMMMPSQGPSRCITRSASRMPLRLTPYGKRPEARVFRRWCPGWFPETAAGEDRGVTPVDAGRMTVIVVPTLI